MLQTWLRILKVVHILGGLQQAERLENVECVWAAFNRLEDDSARTRGFCGNSKNLYPRC